MHDDKKRRRWFWCSLHRKAEAEGTDTRDCLLTGPYSTKEQADEFGGAVRPTPPPSIATQGRSFPICKYHRDADWNEPVMEDDACILCRLFYLEAQESLLEEWQQRATRAEEAIAEIERPLDAQMARLNATVARLNDENEKLRSAQSAKGTPLDPTKEMIEAGAQRLVRWETGKEVWPDAWSKLDVRAARNDAERCWRSMWLASPPTEEGPKE